MYDQVFEALGESIYSYEYIESLREENLKLDPTDKIYNFIPQAGFQEKVLTSMANIVIIGGRRGGGKMQPYDSMVLTPFGFRRMGDLQVGSLISNPNGFTEKVIQIFEHGLKDVYRLKFIDGSCVECGLEHLWLVKKTCSTLKTQNTPFFSDEETFSGKVMTTAEIIDFLNHEKKGKNLLVPLCSPIHFNAGKSSEPKVHPYLLGVLLGDGSVSSGYLRFTSDDAEIAGRLREFGYNVNKLKDKFGWSVTGSTETLKALKGYGVLGCRSYEKFIPEAYKTMSVENRILLMQGLMDTDGYVDSRGHLSYTTTSPRLAKDIQWIIRSLGGKATIRSKYPTYVYKEEKKTGREAFTVYINTAMNPDLVFLPRKKSMTRREFNGGFSELSNRITGYEYAGKKPCRCIQVDNPNGLYLTDDFVVTHNTAVMLLSPLYYIENSAFSCHGFRKEEDDIKRGIWKTSKIFFSGEAQPTESKFTWTFPSGSSIIFEHMQDEKAIDRRYRGVEIPHFIIDELPQIQASTFFTFLASNRNSFGFENKLFASCNPVGPTNWVYQLIRWYLDEETGEVIPERSGVVRYFYKFGSTVKDIIWGDTREEVYEKAKHFIDALYDERMDVLGGDRLNMIMSFTFIEGEYVQNKLFIKSDPLYLSRLAAQGDDQSIRDIKGIWKDSDTTEAMLSSEEMEQFFKNTEQRTGILTAVADVALSRDAFVIGAFDGNHLFDVEAFTGVGSITAAALARKFLEKNHIHESNFLYDMDGIGQYLKEHFPQATGFSNQSAATDNTVWFNKKAECAEKWTQKVKENKYSIDRRLLGRRFGVFTLEELLQTERRALMRKNNSSGKFQLIPKSEMRVILGGRSPDYIDMIFMHEHFNIVKPFKRNGIWMLK